MSPVREKPWPRILAEGAAIVVSILLAFWIQASWEERKEQGDEQVVLQSLLEDLEHKNEVLLRQRRFAADFLPHRTYPWRLGHTFRVSEDQYRA